MLCRPGWLLILDLTASTSDASVSHYYISGSKGGFEFGTQMIASFLQWNHYKDLKKVPDPRMLNVSFTWSLRRTSQQNIFYLPKCAHFFLSWSTRVTNAGEASPALELTLGDVNVKRMTFAHVGLINPSPPSLLGGRPLTLLPFS